MVNDLPDRVSNTSINVNPFGSDSPQIISTTASFTLPFKVTVRFKDKNITQSIGIQYQKTIDNSSTPLPINFTRIKSLTGTSSCYSSYINLGFSGALTYPPCKITTQNISFTNMQYTTTFGFPDVCFGSISTYVYLIPSGWKLGNTVSDGSTWIPAGNNVNVTSDLATGGSIRIRPTNASCGPGLAVNNAYTVVIPISRPAPVLAVAATNTASFCAGATKTYQITGVPIGAQIAWNISNPLIASIVGSNTASTVTLLASSNTGTFTLNATVTDCANTYTSPSIVVKTGVPVITGVNVSGHNNQTGRAGWVILSCDPIPNAINYKWYNENDVLFATTTINRVNSPGRTCNTWYQYSVTATDPCGVSQASFIAYEYTANCNTLNRIAIYPNPTTNEIKVSLDNETPQNQNQVTPPVLFEVHLFDGNSYKILSQKNNLSDKDIKINTQNIPNGIYFLHINNGKETIKKQIIIQH